MGSEYTTLRVKKATRDTINKMAIGRNVSIDELLGLFTKTTKDTVKQILIDVNREKYYTMRDLTQMLHKMKMIESPKVEDAVLLAIDNLIRGLGKQLQVAQTQISKVPTPTDTTIYSQSADMQGP